MSSQSLSSSHIGISLSEGERPSRWYSPQTPRGSEKGGDFGPSADVSWFQVLGNWIGSGGTGVSTDTSVMSSFASSERSFNLGMAAAALDIRGKRAIPGVFCSTSRGPPRTMPSERVRAVRAEIGECQWCGQRTHELMPVPDGFGEGGGTGRRDVEGSTSSFMGSYYDATGSQVHMMGAQGSSAEIQQHCEGPKVLPPSASDLSSAIMGAVGWMAGGNTADANGYQDVEGTRYRAGNPLTVPNVVDDGTCLHCFPDTGARMAPGGADPRRSPTDALRVLRSVGGDGTLSLPGPSEGAGAWPEIMAALARWPDDKAVQAEGCAAVGRWLAARDPSGRGESLRFPGGATDRITTSGAGGPQYGFIGAPPRQRETRRRRDDDYGPHAITAAVDAIVTAMRGHKKDREVQVSALACLVEASSTPAMRGTVASSVAWPPSKHGGARGLSRVSDPVGGIEVIVSIVRERLRLMRQVTGGAMQRERGNGNDIKDADVVEHGCWVLRNLSVPPMAYLSNDRTGEQRREESTVILVRDNINDSEDGFKESWGTIGRVETDASSNSGSGAEGSNGEEIEVIHPDHRPSIVSAGGIDAVLVALAVAVDALASRKRGTREHGIARHGCAILANLTYERPSNKLMVIEKGGTEVLLSVLKCYSDKIEVVEPTLRCLHNLTSVSDGDESGPSCPSETVKNLLAGVSGKEEGFTFPRNECFDVQDLIETMNTHRKSATVQREGCTLLADMAFQHEGRTMKLLTTQGVVPMLFETMRLYPNDGGVQKCACTVFRWCTEWKYSVMHFRQLLEQEGEAKRSKNPKQLMRHAASTFPKSCDKRVKQINWKLRRSIATRL